MKLSAPTALAIGFGLCTAASAGKGAHAEAPAASDATTPAPPILTVQEVEAEELFPLASGARTFEIVDGDGEGRQVMLELSRAAGEGRWQLRLDDYNILHLLENPDGTLLLTRLDVLTEGQTVVYEPPVVLLPGRIVPDRAWTASGRARVLDGNTQEVVNRGEYQHRVLPITRERFTTPAGDHEGFLVSIEQTIDLDAPAVIRLWLDCGFVPDEGLVKRSMKFVLDKPLWFGSTTRRTAELVR